MRLLQTTLRITLITLLLIATAQAGERLRIATGELPPYATEARADKGIALSIVRRAFELAGYQVEYVFMPWNRTLEESRGGRWDGTAYWGYKAEREKDFWLSDNVLTEQWVFLYRQPLKFDWREMADLKPWRVAAIRNYTYTPEFHALVERGVLNVDWTPDDLAALKKLLARRVDVVPIERNVACDLLSHHFKASQTAGLRVHPQLMTPNFTTHLMLPRSLAQSAERMAAFNRGLAQLRRSGEYGRLLNQVSCPAGFAPAAG